MARRGLTGQLNMFDFFRELETNMPQDGEQEMVSLMPNFDDDPEPMEEEKAVFSVESETVSKPMVEVKKENKPEESLTVVKERKVTVETPQEKIKISQEVKREIKQEIKQEIKKEIKQEIKDETLEMPEPVIEEKPVRKQGKTLKKDRPVMQRAYKTKQGTVEIAYINYSKVRVSMPGQEAEIKEFASSKEAVDYYVEQMQKLEEEE